MSRIDEWLEKDKLILLEGWARDGLTYEQIAKNMGIGLTTLKEWRQKEPTIQSTLKKGREVVDFEVENALLKNETTEPLFTEVHIVEHMSSEYKSATFNLSLTVEAVQVANNGDSVLTAEGWPEE